MAEIDGVIDSVVVIAFQKGVSLNEQIFYDYVTFGNPATKSHLLF